MEDQNDLLQQNADFEKMISELIDRRFGICNTFLSASLLEGLKNNLLNYYSSGQMHQAGIGRTSSFQKDVAIRGDAIRWIDNDSVEPMEQALLKIIKAFVTYLNRTCYAGIKDYEFHYAYYDLGSFYKKHYDQFKTNHGRKYSLVMYLNDDWQLSDDGNLSLYLDDMVAEVFPKGGRAVFFSSQGLEHEVHPSFNRPRLSIAGWLKG